MRTRSSSRACRPRSAGKQYWTLAEALERRTLLTALPYGSIVSGNVSSPLATVSYTFSAHAGDVFGLGLTSTPAQAGFLAEAELIAPSSIKKDTILPTGQRLEHPTETGTYTLRVHDSDFKQAGSFTLSLQAIKPASAAATPLVSGGIVGGSITAPLAVKQFTFTGKTGDILSFSMTSSPAEAGFTAFADVFSPSGTRVNGFSASGQHSVTLTETGTFMVEVHDSDFAQKGAFTVGLEGLRPISPGSSPLVSGGFVQGTIDRPIGIKAYTFSGSNGNLIQLSLASTPTQAGFLSLANVYSPSGTKVTSLGPTTPFTLTLHESGTFLVLVHDSDYMQTGTFSLGFEGLAPPSFDALALPAGQTLHGTINVPNDVNEFVFYARANDHITCSLGSSPIQAGFLAKAQISTPAGTRIDAFGGGAPRAFVAPVTGVYLMEVSDFSFLHKGTYTLALNWTSPTFSSVFGNAYNDINGNGTRDAGEAGAFGRRIFLDTNGNGLPDPGERTTTTDVLGNYAFDALDPGTYVVREVLPGGQRFTNPVTGALSVTAALGQNVVGKNFGTMPTTTGSISGRVFNDGNGNGARDVGELGLGLWTVYIDKNNDGKLGAGDLSVQTDANGNWLFKNLVADTYVIRIVQLTGTASTSPASASFTLQLGSGQNIANELFGEKGTS